MTTKITPLTEIQLNSFRSLGSAMGSLATLPMPGTFPSELKDCGINERGTPRNQLVGYVVTQPSGSQLALETVFYDSKENQDNGDLHIINFGDRTLTSHYQGWGSWTGFYGDKHKESKDYLRVGTSNNGS